MTCVQNVHETGFVDLWLITHNTTKVNLYKWHLNYCLMVIGSHEEEIFLTLTEKRKKFNRELE